MRNEVLSLNNADYSEEQKRQAAYALNLCTVSISQIIDYRDSYIMDQEYDAILNNLNLFEMPKDEALLKTLTEILNTITYFRIADLKKAQLEKKYEQRMKNAIWSAVPSLSVVVSGNPVAIAMALITQIGSGYMNYRREKTNALSDKEDLNYSASLSTKITIKSSMHSFLAVFMYGRECIQNMRFLKQECLFSSYFLLQINRMILKGLKNLLKNLSVI